MGTSPFDVIQSLEWLQSGDEGRSKRGSQGEADVRDRSRAGE